MLPDPIVVLFTIRSWGGDVLLHSSSAFFPTQAFCCHRSDLIAAGKRRKKALVGVHCVCVLLQLLVFEVLVIIILVEIYHMENAESVTCHER